MAPKKKSRIRKDEESKAFVAVATAKFATLMKQFAAFKNERIAMLQQSCEFTKIQIPLSVREMTLRQLREMEEKREECVASVIKRKRVRFSSVVEERSLKRRRGRPRLEDYGAPKLPPMAAPLTKCLKAPSPLPRPHETVARLGQARVEGRTPGVGGGEGEGEEALMVVPKGGTLARAALSLLRVPRRGELAVSAAGSPLLAAATAAGDAPSVLVPLRSGDVVSLQATAHTPAASDVAGTLVKGLDSAVRRQLRSLAGTLRAVLDACGDTPLRGPGGGASSSGGGGGGGGGGDGASPAGPSSCRSRASGASASLSGESAATPGRGYGELDSALRQALGESGGTPPPRPCDAQRRLPESTPRRTRTRIPTRKRI